MKVPIHVKDGSFSRKNADGFLFGSNIGCDKMNVSGRAVRRGKENLVSSFGKGKAGGGTSGIGFIKFGKR